jgi:uncharacterized protein YaiI (UPF0178 family)
MDVCPAAEGAADDRIVSRAEPGDLVITRDVGLARRLVAGDIAVMDDRGRSFTRDNINELYSLRCFQVGLAEQGIPIVREAAYGKRELKHFADSLSAAMNRMNTV